MTRLGLAPEDQDIVDDVERVAAGVKPADRWMLLSKTSPSGKAMFVCLSCGQSTVAPSVECREKVYIGAGFRACSEWKPHPEELRQHARR